MAADRACTLTPAQTIARTYQRIRDHDDGAVFIDLRDEKDAIAEAEKLAEFRLGNRRVRRSRAAVARHRHRRQRPRAGDAQQHCGLETEPRHDLDRLVPACRTLDCISVFALTVDDAATTLSVMAGPD